MNCKKATQLISEQYDRKLTIYEKVSLKCHLLICRLCRDIDKQIQDMEKIVKQYKHK